MDFALQPTVFAAAIAAFVVAAGAPVFSDGLRALRLRRNLSRLAETPLADSPTGFVHTRGTVMLDGPLFSPLSGRPCAGYRLIVRGHGSASGVIEERRSFRIVAGAIGARVMPTPAQWSLQETARREIQPGEALTENLAALLATCSEAQWSRRQNRPVVLVEHALLAGQECHVIGQARVARPHELPAEMQVLRTGTDDRGFGASHAVTAGAGVDADPDAGEVDRVEDRGPTERGAGPLGFERRRPGRMFPGEVDLWIEDGGHLDFLFVSDRAPVCAALAPPKWRTVGVVLGPALTLAALVFLARLADLLRSRVGI